MRSLAVLSPSLFEKTDAQKRHLFSIDNLQIPIGLVIGNKPELDEDSDAHQNAVLVRKLSFSLNYRDLGVIENAWRKIESLDQETYYPIGSDFCGVVEKIGKNVTAFAIGDRVISNSFYPFPENDSFPGIPSNHASREFEIYNQGKLIKIPEGITSEQAGGIGIGTQTAMSMIRRANIKPGDNVLVTSITSNTAFFFLNLLRDLDCNVYGLSYSGKNVESVTNHFPFIKDVFSFNENQLPQNLYFDVVLDAFSDTYLVPLSDYLNLNARYLTCGIYNQSVEKITTVEKTNLTLLIASLMTRNVQLIGNCLGSGDDLRNGLQKFETHPLVIDSTFTDNDAIKDFLDQTYNNNGNKFGKVSFIYS
ncbi:zinc-binding alcohol dehydrogenase family protein [Flavobacterium sp.]|uniref:quinone oxidoreductase family protein n=1 Tax=Flavobacterium sp. TaxID=239 RepID=UPI002610C702|nr:zinc-binding alcohol dehydrogenase family protein [Flavobacterium sp.]